MRNDPLIPYHLTSVFTSRLILFFVFIFFCISLLTSQIEMTGLTLFVLAVIGLSRIWSNFAFSGIDVALHTDQTRVFAGDTVHFRMTVTNRKFLPVWIKATDFFDPAVFEGMQAAGQSAFFRSYQTADFTWHLKTRKRGCFEIGNARIIAFDPLGFYPRQKTFRHTETLLIYPRVVPVRALPLSEKHFFGSPGARSPVQDPVYIIGTRDCLQATPAKMIHWKAGARIGRLQEKVCEPSVQGKVCIVLDISGFLENKAFDELEKMIETAASLALAMVKQDQAVGFLTNAAIAQSDDPFIPLGRSRKTVARILETLARTTYTAVDDIPRLLRRHTLSMWGVHCIFCGFLKTDYTDDIHRLLVQKRIPAMVIVSRCGDSDLDVHLPVPVSVQESVCL